MLTCRSESTILLHPAAMLARLTAAGESTTAEDNYASACALAQIWSDIYLIAEASSQPGSVRLRARSGATHAARAALAAAFEPVASAAPSPPAGLAIPSARAGRSSAMTSMIKLHGHLDPWLDMLERILTLPMPECYGYDLGDSTICIDDARQFVCRHGHNRPIVVVGIRSGGSFLAPRWVAGLILATGQRVPWFTLRPLGAAAQRQGYHQTELAQLQRLCQTLPSRPQIVLVDDQPDSGNTVKQLAHVIAPMAEGLWFASIGRVRRLKTHSVWITEQSRSTLRRRDRPALWQLLRPEDHARFLATLAESLPCAAVQTASMLTIRCPTQQRRYGDQKAWLPWNHPQLLHAARRLVNPHKTPLVIWDDMGQPLLHLRFVGAGPFGLAEFQRVQQMAAEPVRAWFIDGYRIAAHIPATRPLRERLAHASQPEINRLLERCAEVLQRTTDHDPRAQIIGTPARRTPGKALCAALAQLGTQIGVTLALPTSLAWIATATIPAFGPQNQPIHSSLCYAHGDWHWQVTPDGKVHRFHLEATWGGVSWQELETAVFVLEHRLSPANLTTLLKYTGSASAQTLATVSASLPAATGLLIDSWRRTLRQVSPAGKAQFLEDLSSLWDVLGQYTDLFAQATDRGGQHA